MKQTRQGKRYAVLGFALVLGWTGAAAAWADNGQSFTLVATEETTKDMSVNLVADTLRDAQIGPDGKYVPVLFGGREIKPPNMAIPKQDAINLVNHDSGILDIQHTFLVSAPLASRILISFETLKQELQKNCWTAQDAPNLRAKLRLYVIPPYGPGKQHRWFGVSPSTHITPSAGLDPPPASVPIAVFEQQQAWVEGDGQNSFFTATYDPAHLLDVQRVGVSKSGTSWEGLPLDDVDLCLNRAPGRVATGNAGNRAELCYDPDPNWQPWMEWDVSKAVQKWLREGFDPATYHGFSLYQYPGVTAEDQIRFAPEEQGKSRSRAVVSFASSSGKADCPGVGGVFGGPSQAEIIFGNGKCMTQDPRDLVWTQLKPGAKAKPIPRILEMKTHPEWAPQLVIEATGPSRQCSAQVEFLPEKPDIATQGRAPLQMRFFALHPEDRLTIQRVQVRPGPGLEAERIGQGCAPGLVLEPGQPCTETLALSAQSPGSAQIAVKVDYLINGASGSTQSVTQFQTLSVSEDYDGTPDAVENLAPNQDANQDQVPDRKQSHVNSVQDPRGGWLSVATHRGLLVEALHFPELKPDAKQGAVQFERGFVGFRIKGLPKGERARVQIQAERPFDPLGTFWGYGPTPDDFAPHWFDYKDMGQYGSKIVDGKVELTLYDGAIGDTDGIANGEILVLGGVGLALGAGKKAPRLTDATVASAGGPFWLLLVGAGAGLFGVERRRKRLLAA